MERLLPFSSPWKNLLLFALTLGLIGPVASFFTLQGQLGYSPFRALLYSVVSFWADLLSIILFALFLSKVFGKRFDAALEVSLLSYLPMWVFDAFDLYQPLRFLSNAGFLTSLFVLWRLLGKKFSLSARGRVLLLLLWTVLYAADALVSEAIAASPLAAKVFKTLWGKGI
ncbi:MAG: hypothetical protein GXO08_04465 [Aquificae bacterium]|nr:hypothetical protein [Aquificota bacterium]